MNADGGRYAKLNRDWAGHLVQMHAERCAQIVSH